MFHSKLGRLLPLAILLSMALPVGVALAAEEGSEVGVLAGLGVGASKLVGEDKKNDPSLLLGLRYANLFADHWGFFVDGVFIPYNGTPEAGDSKELAARLGIEALTGPSHSV